MTIDSNLLKMARARDDAEFVLRISAGMLVHAQSLASNTTLPDQQKALCDWVLANPLVPMPKVIAFITANTAVAAKLTYIEGVISGDAITDEDIMGTLQQRWPLIAAFLQKYGA